MEPITYSLQEIKEVAKKIVKNRESNILSFEGSMGSGKTTLIKSFCEELKVREPISSPTFSLVNVYESIEGTIYHFDFYRLKHLNEALDFGVEEYFESGKLCLLEWAGKIVSCLPSNIDVYQISVGDGGYRTVEKKKEQF